MKVRIKKLHIMAQLPKYAKEGDAGLDLTAVTKTNTGKYVEYGTGLAIEIPEGFAGFIFPRSSVTNKNMMVKNAVGVVDSGYRGEIKVRFHQLAIQDNYENGDRVAQLVIMPVPYVDLVEVEELADSERGTGGYGSTGTGGEFKVAKHFEHNGNIGF